ncbi:MAG: cation:proton antiporter [Alphaproteobacteria bacterium]|jgi:multicomponent K+:H+ antiporter subunit E|nr:cation:proton antiporter [Alphaproteobacteria bacterium]
MTRLIPYPLLALALFVMWLLLTQSFSPGQALLGAMVTFLAVLGIAALRPRPSPIRSWRALVRLMALVAIDIVRSNFAVAWIVLFPRSGMVSSFVRLPVDLTDRNALTVLALIVTATPGTCWVQFDRSEGVLLVHVLDLVDEQAWIRLIKDRYETLLMEVFGR